MFPALARPGAPITRKLGLESQSWTERTLTDGQQSSGGKSKRKTAVAGSGAVVSPCREWSWPRCGTAGGCTANYPLIRCVGYCFPVLTARGIRQLSLQPLVIGFSSRSAPVFCRSTYQQSVCRIHRCALITTRHRDAWVAGQKQDLLIGWQC